MEDVLSRMQKAVEQDKVETLVMTVSKAPFEKLALATENRERFKKMGKHLETSGPKTPVLGCFGSIRV